MPLVLSSVRILLYAVLAFFSLIVLALSAARLYYTTHLTSGGQRFYEPAVAELLATSLLSVGWAVFSTHAIHGRLEVRWVGTILGELAGLGILFLLWLVGACITASAWGNVALCTSHACQLLAALLAFAWLSWLIVLALFVVSLMFAIANKAWSEPLHGRWDPRLSLYHE